MLDGICARAQQHMQLNVLDSEVLKKPQQHPEEDRTLSGGVVGYSAYL